MWVSTNSAGAERDTDSGRRSAGRTTLPADMLSQAEHDELAMSLLITDSAEVADRTAGRAGKTAGGSAQTGHCGKSLSAYGGIVLVGDMKEAVSIANRIAPEHLELCVTEPEKLLPEIRNAGAVFMGHYSPEPLGDYYAGPTMCCPRRVRRAFSRRSAWTTISKKSA